MGSSIVETFYKLIKQKDLHWGLVYQEKDLI